METLTAKLKIIFCRNKGRRNDGVILIQSFSSGLNCTPPAIDDFPRDFFTEKERQDGAVVVHVVVSLYLFVALAVVCDKFFVPAVEKICHGEASPSRIGTS
jgi:hypothetical protein